MRISWSVSVFGAFMLNKEGACTNKEGATHQADEAVRCAYENRERMLRNERIPTTPSS